MDFSFRFIYQHNELLRQVDKGAQSPEFAPYVFQSPEEKEREQEKQKFSLPEGETPETLHYKLSGGYEVQEGDTLTGIVKNVFGKKLDYAFPVEYRSEKIQEPKPKTVLETNKIYPKQYIIWTMSGIIIADEPISPTEFSMPPLMMSAFPMTEEETKEETKESKEKDVSDVWGEYVPMHVSDELGQMAAIESVFETHHTEPPKEVLHFISNNDLSIQPQQVYVEKGGIAAFPLRKNAVGGGEIVFTVFIDGNGNVGLYDQNSKGVRKTETLQEAYDLAVYNEILDYELTVINRGNNRGVEDVDRYLTDDDLSVIVEELDIVGHSDMHPVTAHSQRIMREFVKNWIHKANREVYIQGGNIPVSKVMKQVLSKNGDEKNTIQREKVREMTQFVFLTPEKKIKEKETL